MEPRRVKKLAILFLISIVMYITANTANAYLVHILGHGTYGDYSVTIALIFFINSSTIYWNANISHKAHTDTIKKQPKPRKRFLEMER